MNEKSKKLIEAIGLLNEDTILQAEEYSKENFAVNSSGEFNEILIGENSEPLVKTNKIKFKSPQFAGLVAAVLILAIGTAVMFKAFYPEEEAELPSVADTSDTTQAPESGYTVALTIPTSVQIVESGVITDVMTETPATDYIISSDVDATVVSMLESKWNSEINVTRGVTTAPVATNAKTTAPVATTAENVHTYPPATTFGGLYPVDSVAGGRRNEITNEQLVEMVENGIIPRDIEFLDLGENRLTDISPLSKLINLNILLLYGNQINDLSPLSELTKLERLNLGNNQITDLSPLSELTNLNFLILENNQINDLMPLSELTRLEVLILSENQITDISPLRKLINMEKLQINRNKITDISPLTSMKNLYSLYVDYEAVDLENFPPSYSDSYWKGYEIRILKQEYPLSESNPLGKLSELKDLVIYKESIPW